MKRLLLGLLALIGLTLAGNALTHGQETKGDKKVNHQVFEMRTYYTFPGKMEALHSRFRNHTCKLLEKHGMKLVGFWTPLDAKEAERKMVYIVAHASREAAKSNWKSFGADPDWIAAKKASEKDGKIVEKVEAVFLNPTDYSPLK